MIKVAVVQASPVLFNKQACIERVAEWTAKAADTNAQLVLFPEAFIPAYPRGMSFGTVVGSRSEEGRKQWLAYAQNSVEVPSLDTQQLGAIARQYGILLVIGVVEREKAGGSLYCTMLYFGPSGDLIHKHRKLKPTAAERIIWGEGDGSTLNVLDTPIGKVGGLICWENYMPLARMALYQQGIQIYLAPTADQRDSWTASMQHIATEGRCFVLSCNQYVTKVDYPERYQDEIKEIPNPISRGGSMIVSPLGKILAGPLFDQEGILTAELELTETLAGKMDFDVVGHYNRTDVFSYRWNLQP